jgi:CubicO group peptidase (beta-lactamase class C family)
MTATTFEFAKAEAGNHASAHAPDVDGKTAKALMEVNYAAIPVRPAGAAWSSVREMLQYVSMELADGKLPDGTRYIEKQTLLERRVPQAALDKDASYGMGLMVDNPANPTLPGRARRHHHLAGMHRAKLPCLLSGIRVLGH